MDASLEAKKKMLIGGMNFKGKDGMKVYKAGGRRPDYRCRQRKDKEEPLEEALKDAGKAYKGMKIKKAPVAVQ